LGGTQRSAAERFYRGRGVLLLDLIFPGLPGGTICFPQQEVKCDEDVAICPTN